MRDSGAKNSCCPPGGCNRVPSGGRTAGQRGTEHDRPPDSRSMSMAANPSFDIVSKVDRQEVDNALRQAEKELATRFDFRGTGAEISWSGEEAIGLQAETEERVRAALDVFKEKLVKRNISLKSLDAGDPRPSGKVFKIDCKVIQGIETDKAKAISKKIRDEGPKGVQAQIQGDQLRVTGKKKDDLQAVIALLKGEDFGVALQFTNYR
ncbi:YajQ family cyclic di-GMP-binding protein [Micromonospora globispora]|uniref:Nucleotide-binding protein DLJ46_07885 n=2 Tax=Micromonospora globispora TaxID=1450148 RepID=A0A317KEV3_9ACTN|nr:YajQ family cyclic di-GMP-binding protein [Micromonospora globispora]RQW98284.1 YajQ family cyclic di-GMP-binding protein [Micromonospora globispora]